MISDKMKNTLCFNNLCVKENFNKLKKLIKQLGITNVELIAIINDGLETLRVMKKQGQKLEDRCRKYRYSIESLGFTRKKRKNKTLDK